MRQKRFHRCGWMLPAVAVGLLGSVPAHADMIINFQTVTVPAGTIGAAFDFNITNNGPSAQNIAVFSLSFSVSDANITFTGGNVSTTNTYLFAGDSFDVINGFAYTTVPPPDGQTVESSDLSNSGNGTSVPVTTLGLGHIFFNVALGTPTESIAVTIVPDCSSANSCTDLVDANGNEVPFTVGSGTINVTASSSTPEPSTLSLALFALPVIVLRRRRSIPPSYGR